MNLIEQLGGYEKALDLFRGCPWDSGTVDVPNPRSKGMLRLDLNDLGYELLEYRRQHNIFEVGDFIFHPMFGALFEIKRIAEKYVVASTKSGYETNLLIELISHATDVEIKAGKRLEVS